MTLLRASVLAGFSLGALSAAIAQSGTAYYGFRIIASKFKATPSIDVASSNQRKPSSLKVVFARTVRRQGSNVILDGGFSADLSGRTVSGQRLSIDLDTEDFEAFGSIVYRDGEETVTSEALTYQSSNDVYTFRSGRAVLPPSRTGPDVRGNLYVTTSTGVGTPRDYRMEDSTITTCDLDSPHFGISSESSRILPGRRAVLRKTRVRVLNRTLLTLPYLSIPLTMQSERYLPEVGESPDEGYFVQGTFSTPIRGESILDTTLRAMTKKGLSTALLLRYDDELASGAIGASYLLGSNSSVVLRGQHEQALAGGRLALSTTYQRANYLTAPDSTLWATSSQFLLPIQGRPLRLGFFRSSNSTTGFSSVSQSVSVSDSRPIAGVQNRVDLSLNRSESSGLNQNPIASERLEVRYSGTLDSTLLDTELEYIRSVPVSGETRSPSSTDSTPTVTVRTDLRRLLGSLPGRRGSPRLALSLGERASPATGSRIGRFFFEADSSNSIGNTFNTFRSNLRFRQGVYSDGTAQYNLSAQLGARYRAWSATDLRVDYTYLRLFGFTPLSIDQTGRSDGFGFGLETRPLRAVTLLAGTGYDVVSSSRGQVGWQTGTLRAQWRPGPSIDVSSSAVYDPNRSVWSSLRLDARLTKGSTALRLGTRYDGVRSTWGSVFADVQGLKIGRTSVSVLLDYNGYRKDFDTRHIQVLYDLHCVEAALQIIDNRVGFRSGQTIAFFLRIRALPGDSPFGTGRRGQAVGSGGSLIP